MKHPYIKPVIEVYITETAGGILNPTSYVGDVDELSDFYGGIGSGEGDGEDFGRYDRPNHNNNLWEQGW